MPSKTNAWCKVVLVKVAIVAVLSIHTGKGESSVQVQAQYSNAGRPVIVKVG